MRMTEAEFQELQKRMTSKQARKLQEFLGQNLPAITQPDIAKALRGEPVELQDPKAQHPPRKSTDEEKLNKTERAYLAHLRMLGYQVGIQNVTVKLADDTRYTPDFSYYDTNDNFILVDTKGGFTREDAWIKAKVAARMFPRWIWQLAIKTKSGWDIKVVKP